MGNQNATWWKQSAIPKLFSLALTALTVTMARRQIPMMLDWAQDKALLNTGVLIWPLVLLPWLVGLPRKHQLLSLFCGTAAGYWLMGHPIGGLLHGMPFPNINVLPKVLLAMPAGFFLLMALDYQAKKRWFNALLWGAPLVGMALLLFTVIPTNAALRLQQGEVKAVNVALEVVETHELEADLVAAYTYGDVLVAIGQKEWLWRDSHETAQIRPGSYDPWRVTVHCDGQRLYIVELAKGRLECYSYPGGELLWTGEDLGVITDIAWTTNHAWVLNCPELDYTWPYPEELEVLLHQFNLEDGQSVKAKVVPPDNRFWKRASSGPLAALDSNQEQAWVKGTSSPEKPVYQSTSHFEYSEADQIFIYRPAQGELGELWRSFPDGLSPHSSRNDGLFNYLTGDLVIDSSPNVTFTDSIVRARSLVTGQVIWRRSLARAFPPPIPFAAHGKVLLNSGQELLCLNESDGTQYWSYPHQASLRWVHLLGEDIVFGLADGTIVRMGADGKPVWQYSAQGLSNLEKVDTVAGILTIKDSGIRDGENFSFSFGGTYVTLSLADGTVIPVAKPQLEGGNYAVSGEFLWYMKQFTYRPGPYNGDKAVYRLAGQRVTVRDLNMPREDVLVRPDFLMLAEQIGSKARLSILRVKD